MNKNKILSGGGKNLIGGGKWGRRGREVGGKGEGTGNWVPPCPPPQFCDSPSLRPYPRIDTIRLYWLFKISENEAYSVSLKSTCWVLLALLATFSNIEITQKDFFVRPSACLCVCDRLSVCLPVCLSVCLLPSCSRKGPQKN